jgi:hypothetical protein
MEQLFLHLGVDSLRKAKAVLRPDPYILSKTKSDLTRGSTKCV